MKRNIFQYLLPAFIIICSSCTSNEPTMNIPKDDRVLIATEIVAPINTNTSVVEETGQVSTQCWPIITLQEQNSINGSLVFAHYGYNYRENGDITSNEFLIWDISSSEQIQKKIITDTIYRDDYYVTPDGKYFAKIMGKEFMLLSLDDKKSFILPLENMRIRSFIFNNRVLLYPIPLFREDDEQKDTFTYYILDMSTGNITDDEITLPNLVDPKRIQFHPDMRYVVYQSKFGEESPKFSLFDIEKNEIIWNQPNMSENLKKASFDIPAWIPNSEELVDIYFDKYDVNFFTISINGNVNPLTHFKDTSVDNIPSHIWWGSSFAYPNWSPTGDYMVFQKSINDSGERPIDIWYDQEETVYEPCIPREDERTSTTYHGFTWSYDGKYLLVTIVVPTYNEDTVIDNNIIETYPIQYILDLKKKVIYKPPDGQDEFIKFRTDDLDLNIFLGWVDWELP